MSKNNLHTPLIAIVGPTASGKSDLALKIAQQCQGEIIAADSRTIYRDLSLGTAKPTQLEQKLVPHHLLDVVVPGEPFTAADFKRLAKQAISDIRGRGNLPILVGGTGLYVDAVVYDFEFPQSGVADRSAFQNLPIEELQQRVSDLGVALNNSDWNNPRRLIRVLETGGSPKSRQPLPGNVLYLGLDRSPTDLEKRIRVRLQQMIDDGLVDEVAAAIHKYGSDSEAMTGIAYRAFAGVKEGSKSLPEAFEENVRGDLNLAKRQMTWFKRNPDIKWVTTSEEAMELVKRFLEGL